jgi:hypothetical protein
LPEQEVRPGDAVGLTFELLPVEDFARSIPDFTLTNAADMRWLADAAVLKDFKVVDGVMKFEALQTNRWSSVGSYVIKGEVVKYPGVINQLGAVYAEIAIKDYAGRVRDIRIRYDGFSAASLGIGMGGSYPSVLHVSYDGFRLSAAYDNFRAVTTIYIEAPSVSIYKLGMPHPYSGSYLRLVEGRYTKASQIDNIEMVRDLEKGMLAYGGTYDLGRLGAEIAYVVADKNLGLKNIILEEPSKGGRDLYTQDNSVAIQARLLKDFTQDSRETLIQQALYNLSDKLQQDYENQSQMRDGYAILSYLDADGIMKTIVLEVPKW